MNKRFFTIDETLEDANIDSLVDVPLDESLFEVNTIEEIQPEPEYLYDPVVETQEINSIERIEEWLGEINPNYNEFDRDSPYCNNCGSCALAVYNRLNGSVDACAGVDNIDCNPEMEFLTGTKFVSMSPEAIERELLEQGSGAHAIIGIDRADSYGHWFNAANVDGKIIAIDGQPGIITDWPPDDLGEVVNWEMSVK